MRYEKSAFRQFTAKEVRALAGLTFKNLADWDAKGLLFSGARSSGGGWRRFGYDDLFVLMIAAHLRLRFSVPLDQLRWVRGAMEKRAGDDLRRGLRLLAEREEILLLTDLRQHLHIDRQVRIAAMVRRGLLRAGKTDSAILVNITPLLEKIKELNDEVWTPEPEVDDRDLALVRRRGAREVQVEWKADPLMMPPVRRRRSRGEA